MYVFFSKLLFVPSGVKLSMHKKKSGVFMWTEAKQVYKKKNANRGA